MRTVSTFDLKSYEAFGILAGMEISLTTHMSLLSRNTRNILRYFYGKIVADTINCNTFAGEQVFSAVKSVSRKRLINRIYRYEGP